MPKVLKRADAETALRDPKARYKALRALPEDVDPVLAAEVAFELAGKHLWMFGRSCRALPESVIREVLVRMESTNAPFSVFIREHVRTGEQLSESWSEAIGALLDFDSTYAWGSKERKAKFARIAGNPRLLAATQAVAVGCPSTPTSMLAVLALDGSEASVDALLPNFVRAAETRDAGLDLLARLETHASHTPAVDAMLAQVKAMLGERNAQSPALDVARAIVGEVDEFWFSAWLGSVDINSFRVPVHQANLHIDSRDHGWFSVSVSAGSQYISFDVDTVHRDTMGVGRCTAAELPAWLARVARERGFAWDFEAISIRTGLRGKKRERLLEWLSTGGSRSEAHDSE